MSFLGSFLGYDQQKDIKSAKAASDVALKTGLDTGTAQYEAAKTYFDPYAASGQAANAMYSSAIGLNGQPAYQQVVDNFMGDPFRQSNEDFANKQLANLYNAKGGLYAGNAMLAAARGSLERGSTDWNAWLDRLNGQQGVGYQAASSQAGLTQGQGDMAYGYGQTKAGNEINFGNAMASARNIGINNILGAAGTVAKFVAPNPYSLAYNAMKPGSK
jgi:hypothetical protein